MSPDRFTEVCEAIWGAQWRHPAAEALGVAYRTVTRWESGEQPIPDGIPGELAVAAIKRSQALMTLAEQLARNPQQ